MDRLIRDLRYAARRLARTPGFTAVTVLVLALGIGAGTAIFGIVHAILFRPLPLPDSDRLVTICETHPSMAGYCSASVPNVMDWRGQAGEFTAMGAARGNSFSMRTESGARGVAGGIATPGFFRALGYRAFRGRLLEDGDLPPAGSGRVAVVTYGFWQTELGADPGVVGSTIRLDEESYTVVGVLPPRTFVPRLDWVRVWTALPFDPRDEENRDWRGFAVAARLAPGATVESAEKELAGIDVALAREHPDALRGWGVDVRTMRDFLVAGTRPVLLMFLAAVGLVLLIVCVNMASLLIARTASRRHELAVRSALGAGRGQIVRQLLAEATLLALAGGVGGLVVADWATDAFVALAPPGIPRISEVTVSLGVLAFGLTIALIAGGVFGLVPALRGGRVPSSEALREGRMPSQGRSGSRVRKALVVGELGMAVVLVAAASLLLRSFTGLLDWRPGFETGHVLTFQVYASPGKYANADQVLDLYRRMRERLSALPGVRSVGQVSAGPLFGGGDGASGMLIEGRAGQRREDAPPVAWFNVGPGYFETLGVPLLAGRGLGARDVEGAPPVALVNDAFARRFWPTGSPVGARVSFPELERSAEIVGVVGDIQPFHPDEPPEPEIYFPYAQGPRWATFFVLRTATDPAASAGPAGDAIQRIDPDIQPAHVSTMDQLVARQLIGPRFEMALMGAFAGLALLLGAVGIYGVIAFSVAARTREIGIRMALGARRSEILRRVVAEGLGLSGLGLALGLVGAALASRLLSGMLYGVQTTDPTALLGTVLVLTFVSLLATLMPALKASALDPVLALRQE